MRAHSFASDAATATADDNEAALDAASAASFSVLARIRIPHADNCIMLVDIEAAVVPEDCPSVARISGC